MIETLPAPDHVAAFRVRGTLTEADYDLIIPALETRLAEHGRIGVYVDFEKFDGLTAGAFRRDIGYALDRFGEWHRFSRAALTTDTQWIKAAITLFDKLLPRSELRAFPPDQKDEALAWAAQVPRQPKK